MDETKDQVIDVADALRHFANNQYGDASYAKEWLNLLADRIDNEYLCLPLDADGVPIRPGDEVAFAENAPITVDSIGTSKVYEGDFGFFGNNAGFYGQGTLKHVRHVEQDTVESVLMQMLDEAVASIDATHHISEDEDWFKSYAERIRRCLD